MLYAVGAPLPEYRVRAFNNAADSTNRIHDNEHARRYGFRGGLVPGVSVYAYMARSLVEFMGRSWLERGRAEVRFIHPAYEGEEIRVTGSLTSVRKDGTLQIALEAANPQGIRCAAGTAALPCSPSEPAPALESYPAGRAGQVRTITLETLTPGEPLDPIAAEFSRATHWEYCQKAIRDHHPIWEETPHPGWLLGQANRIFAANYELPPWIHVSSAVQSYRVLEHEGALEVRGRVADKFERKGHHYAILDVALFAGTDCLQTIRHTAIFQIAPRAA